MQTRPTPTKSTTPEMIRPAKTQPTALELAVKELNHIDKTLRKACTNPAMMSAEDYTAMQAAYQAVCNRVNELRAVWAGVRN